MRSSRLLPMVTLLLIAEVARAEPVRLTPAEAIEHVDKAATVCGVVGNASYAPDHLGAPTFLSLGPSRLQGGFTAVVWSDARSELTYRPEWLGGKRICVTGTIFFHYGDAYINVLSARQIELRER